MDFNNTVATISVIAVNNTGNSNPFSIMITMNTNPVVNLAIPQDSVCLNWGPIALSGGTPLQGTYTGSGVNNNVFNPSLAGVGNHIITYTFESANGCSAQDFDTIYVDLCTDIPENTSVNQQLQVFPNPCLTECTVTIPATNAQSDVYIYNVSGLLVQNFATHNSCFTLQSKDFPGGLYFIRVVSSTGMQFAAKVQF